MQNNPAEMEWIEFQLPEDFQKITSFLNEHPYSGIWHEPAWLDFQKAIRRVQGGSFRALKRNGTIDLFFLILLRKSRFNRFGYIPAGPLYRNPDRTLYEAFIHYLEKIAHIYRLDFIEIDWITPDDPVLELIQSRLKNHHFNIKTPIPGFSNQIDLTQSEEEILAQMKSKGRYNIKLAEKKGVVIREGSAADIPAFYEMLKETTLRDGFRPNPLSYYEEFLKNIPQSKLFLAYHENDLLAGGIFTFTKQQGLYYYGASSNIKRNLMAPYLIQWHGITEAKKAGCKIYDFLGIADPENPNDPLQAVTEFKMKFSEKIVRFNRPFRLVTRPFRYRTVELFRKLIRK